MTKFAFGPTSRAWSISVILISLLAACGGGGGDGGGGGGGSSALAPGTACLAGAPLIPTVTSSEPSDGNQFASTSTSGVAGGGKAIRATFSVAMDPGTINAASFTVATASGMPLVPASVSYNAATRVATFTTATALQTDTTYIATISLGVFSLAGAQAACAYGFSFKTAVTAAAGLSPVNLGTIATFGIAASAGITNTGTAPTSHINGDLVLNPNDTCNAVSVDNVGGFGLCGGFPPTITGRVITPTFPDTTTANAVMADLSAAFLSITPPAGPPAAGSLGGATAIAAGTTLGAPTGNPFVQGDNYFVPGVYQSTTSILITGDLTLDAQGNTDAVFIFQSSSTVGTAVGARILLVNGAKASNVYWQAATSATLGTLSEFQGNILAGASITMNLNATSCGRLLAGAFTNGAFVLDSNVISVPGNASAPPSCR